MALIGVAFSLGFLFGPMIGAAFSMWGKQQESGNWYIYPAVFALILSVVDIFYLALFLKVGSSGLKDHYRTLHIQESLPESKRNQSTAETLEQALSYINPLQLFRL